MTTSFRVADALERAGIAYETAGASRDDTFTAVAPFDDPAPGAAIFLNAPCADSLDAIRQATTRVFVVERKWGTAARAELDTIDAAIFLVDHPRLAMARVLRQLHPEEDEQPPGIHPTAIVDPAAELHPSVRIGPYSVIGKCTVGEDSRIGSFCSIGGGARIGARVVVRDHCVIGGAGFGFARNESRTLERVPHVGGVILEDDVEVFPFANVDRGTLAPTRVGRGTKLDHYVHIGHNCAVGEDTIVTAGVVMCGSSRVGNRSWIGVGAIIREGVFVGSDATIGLGAVVLRDVVDGATVAGVPARILTPRTSLA